MKKLNDYISKKVISLDEGNLVGYVVNLVFDDELKIFDGLIVVDEESENTFILDRQHIVSEGDDCVMIENSAKLQFCISSMSNNPINKDVYDGFGNILGRVKEVEAEGKFVRKIITNRCEFTPRFIRKAGDNFIILGRKKVRRDKGSFKGQVGEVSNNETVLPISYVSTEGDSNFGVAETPARLFANSNILIGKMVTNNILGLNNELIASKFDIIDKKIINKAKNHNKLNLLAYYSK